MLNDLGLNSVRLLVTGERACFRRPEFVDDFVTYDMMPPTIAKRLLRIIYPAPAACWQPVSIKVLNPIDREWTSVSTPRGQRRALLLKEVAYIVEAVLDTVDPDLIVKTRSAAERDIHLGLVDFKGRVRPLDKADHPTSCYANAGALDLGWILYDTGGN